MHLHQWVELERIGRVVTERCTVCQRTRTRVRGAVSASPERPVVGYPDDRMKRPGGLTGPSSRIQSVARQGGNEGT